MQISSRIGNRLSCLSLVDTGSSLTCAGNRLAKSLGKKIEPSSVNSVMGVSGNAINIEGCAKVPIQLGNYTVEADMHFTEHRISNSTYEVIVGNDGLQKLPPLT